MPLTSTLPEQLRRMDAGRLRRYAEHLAFYGGDQWPPTTVRRSNRRLVFNYAKAIIDKTASYLMTGLNIAVDPVDDYAGSGGARTRRRARARPRRTTTTRSTSSTSTRRSTRRSSATARTR